MVCAETVHEAFDAMYYLEQAARVTVKAMSTGRPLKIVPDAVSSPLLSRYLTSIAGMIAGMVFRCSWC